MLGLKRRPRIEEVVFADDFFRTIENGLPPASRENRKFLSAFFGTSASRLGWRTKEVSPRSQGGQIPVHRIMEALGLPPSPEGWAAACTADLGQAAEELAAMALSPTTLVIGWGLPPSFLHYIDRLGAAFIDVELHSIRFTRDLHLVMRTNDPGIRRELERLRLDDELFWSSAAGLRAHFARRGQSFILRPDLNVGLFLGQMAVDLAAVGSGRVMKPIDFVTQIAEWAQAVDVLAIRPHPAEIETSHLHALLDSIPNAVLVGGNTYSLLCADNLAFVGSVSSGALNEASYLGCNDIRRLLLDDRNLAHRLPPTCSPWIPVKLEVASMRSLEAFARARQSTWHWPPTRFSTLAPSAFPEDMLNPIIGYRWGLDPTANGLPELPRLAPGQTLSLALGTPGATCAIFGHGWHWPEDWGVWSADARACLVIPLCEADAEPLSSDHFAFSLCGHVYTPDPAKPPRIRIVVNGLECRLSANASGSMTWTVELGIDAIAHGVLVVVVNVQGALRQCDLGGHPDDQRSFGLGLRYVTFSKNANRTPESSAQEPA
ncbi:hypothetical protein [Burkholderia gladioli]|uniref:hypothetical protein n=1 Tax=Burkholderia gladioli TaxID=28095 RepID=UPI0016409B9A|nr:hypothetical protein [Burkholderia gladioli]